MTRRIDHQLLEADRILLGMPVARALNAENQTPGKTTVTRLRRLRARVIVARATVGPTEWTLDRLRWTVCLRKHRYGRQTARLVAQHLRDGGKPISPYRCPFPDEHGKTHWHIGHAPKMETVVMIARAIRGLPLVDDRNLAPTPSPHVNDRVTVKA